MDLDLNDPRQRALILARARIVAGLLLFFFPGVSSRVLFGRSAATPAARALSRMMGIRDVVLGVGAVTSVKEGTLDAEWVSSGAVADGVDALAMLLTPGLPKRARLMPLVSGAAAVLGMQSARVMADERAESASAELDAE
jgi:hypothetical protein